MSSFLADMFWPLPPAAGNCQLRDEDEESYGTVGDSCSLDDSTTTIYSTLQRDIPPKAEQSQDQEDPKPPPKSPYPSPQMLPLVTTTQLLEAKKSLKQTPTSTEPTDQIPRKGVIVERNIFDKKDIMAELDRGTPLHLIFANAQSQNEDPLLYPSTLPTGGNVVCTKRTVRTYFEPSGVPEVAEVAAPTSPELPTTPEPPSYTDETDVESSSSIIPGHQMETVTVEAKEMIGNQVSFTLHAPIAAEPRVLQRDQSWQIYADAMNLFESAQSMIVVPQIFSEDPAPRCCQFISSAAIKAQTGETLVTVRGKPFCCCERFCNCCNPMNLEMVNAKGQCIVKVEAPKYKGVRKVCCFSPQEVRVHCLDKFIGSVSLSSSLCSPKFKILDDEQRTTFVIAGPSQFQLMICCICCPHTYNVTAVDRKRNVGFIDRLNEPCCRSKYGKPLPAAEVLLDKIYGGEERILLLAATLFIEHLHSHRHFLQ